MDACTATNAYRNGLSVITVNGLEIRGGSYSGSVGTAPQAGIDLEPNYDYQPLTNVRMFGVTATGNAGAGLLVQLHPAPTAVQRGIACTDCRITGNAGVNLVLAYPNSVTIRGGEITSSASFGVDWESSGRDVTFDGVLISKNAGKGIAIAPGSGAITRVKVVNSQVLDNSTGSPGVNDGIRIAPSGSATVSDVAILGTTFANEDTSAQAHGLTTSSTAVSKLRIVGSHFGPHAGSGVMLGDDPASRLVSGTTGLGNMIAFASAAPASGTWTQGDVVWNSGASAGGSPGWVCVTSGTPGTWKAMAILAP
jgi:hypothetical protein